MATVTSWPNADDDDDFALEDLVLVRVLVAVNTVGSRSPCILDASFGSRHSS